MANGYLAWDLLLLENRVRVLGRKIERRVLRDAQNPFDLPQDQFLDTFRVSQDLAMEVVDSLRVDLVRQRSSGLAPEIQVLAALQFYAQGSCQRSVGDQHHFNLSQPAVSMCVTAVTNLINARLLRPWVRFPMTRAERQEARQKFAYARQPFEGAIGAIDCTHINILAPETHEEAFANHHGNHSLNVQAVVDPEMRVLNINARYPGARSDAYIWSQSAVRDAMSYYFDGGERNTWLIGDAGYPLEPWLLTPLNHYQAGTRQYAYTQQLCQARTVVERFFGVLKSMFRCLSFQRVLLYNPAMAGKIVNACVVLHNMRLHHRMPMEFADPPGDSYRQAATTGNPRNRLTDTTSRAGRHSVAVRIQNELMEDRFPTLRDGNAAA